MVNMPSPSITAVSAETSSRRDWVSTGAALGFGTLCFALIFNPEISAAVRVWMNSDAYSHCFLVLPVAAYLAWERRQAAAATTVRPAAWIALSAILVAAAWFMAHRLGIMEGRQLMAMTLFQLMVASLLGLQTWRALSAPLLYLFFLVPFGESVVTPLQSLVVHFTTASLDLLGIANFSDGVTIEIPEGTFLVHQACSGLRFLIASAAFGVLFACLMFTSPLRRVLFVVLSVAVAIVGNCLRVVGIIVIAHFIGNAQAVDTGHVLWGWLFYLIIGSVLILIGLTFRQPAPLVIRATPPTSGHSTAASIIALVVMILLATTPTIAANYLDQRGTGTAEATQIDAPPLPGCITVPLSSAPTIPPADDGLSLGSPRSTAYRCGGDIFVLTLRRYPARIGVRPLFLSLGAAATLADADVILQTGDILIGSGPEASLWRVTELSTEAGYATVATALWLNGRPSGTGITARLTQALNTVRPSAMSPVLATVTYSGSQSLNSAQRAIDDFLLRVAPLSESIKKSVFGP
jgi:exosortase A